MNLDFDFYAPVRLPDGRILYGAAAANWRMAQTDGFNNFSITLVNTALKLGYRQAVNDMKQGRQRR